MPQRIAFERIIEFFPRKDFLTWRVIFWFSCIQVGKQCQDANEKYGRQPHRFVVVVMIALLVLYLQNIILNNLIFCSKKLSLAMIGGGLVRWVHEELSVKVKAVRSSVTFVHLCLSFFGVLHNTGSVRVKMQEL